jgi:hypothetical protein
MLIDLRKLREPLAADIRNSLLTFSAEHPDTQVSTVGLWGDGFHGTASLHLDTPENSAAFVNEWLKEGPAYYGQDAKGRFCNSCWDFPHCIGEYSFPEYPDLYEADPPVDYVTLDGTTARAEAGEGNEGKNRIVFPLLKAVLVSFQPFSGLVRASPFRVGVQMRDSRFAEFWVEDTPKSDQAMRCRELVRPPQRWGPGNRYLLWLEVVDGQAKMMNWNPTTEAEQTEAEQFYAAAMQLDWSSGNIQKVRY